MALSRKVLILQFCALSDSRPCTDGFPGLNRFQLQHTAFLYPIAEFQRTIFSWPGPRSIRFLTAQRTTPEAGPQGLERSYGGLGQRQTEMWACTKRVTMSYSLSEEAWTQYRLATPGSSTTQHSYA
jgi:hypothetical protein